MIAASAIGSVRDLHVCHFSTTTLESKYFKTLGAGLASRGVTLSGVTLVAPDPPEWLAVAGGSFLFLDATSRASYPRAALQLARWLRRHRVTVLQTHLFDASVVGLVAGRLARVPLVVVTRHHGNYHLVSGTRMHVLVDSLTARCADRVVVLSHAVRDHLVERERVPAEKIDAIDQGFDFDALAGTDEDGRRVRTELGLDGAFVVGAVASFQPAKGHVYLLRAVRALADEIPNVKVLLVGAGDRSAVEAAAHDLGLADRVVFAGFRRDVAACVRAMDVFVHPSLSEAFCQAIVEAMAAERPVVATRVGGAPEAIADGESGFLVPASDPDAIAAAVGRVHRDPAFGRRVAESGRRSVMERYTIDGMIAAQIECYRRGLAGVAPMTPAPQSAGVPRG